MESGRWDQSMKEAAHTSSAQERAVHQNFPGSQFAGFLGMLGLGANEIGSRKH